MKKNTKLSGLYLGIVFFLMYLPVAVVIIFSSDSLQFFYICYFTVKTDHQ